MVGGDGQRRRLSTFQPADKAELQTAMDAWCSDESGATATYGAVETWDTSGVTDMSYLLYGKTECNPPIGAWDVSQVTKMKYVTDDREPHTTTYRCRHSKPNP